MSFKFPPEQNPRDVFPQHRERGPKKFHFTYADIAELAGTSKEAVIQAASREDFVPQNLRSVFVFLLERLNREDLIQRHQKHQEARESAARRGQEVAPRRAHL